MLLVDQVKMYSDGITINGTAKTLAPYLDTYIPDEPYGINYIPPSQMKTWLDALDKLVTARIFMLLVMERFANHLMQLNMHVIMVN
ncbi:Uncharacterised protein [Vibrio anguillarum]|nr:Uncharacterised protein [Vibrio anguillarum]